MTLPAFPKPGQIKKVIPWIKIFPNEQEILNLKTKAGSDEYQRRKLEMWDRQGKRCALMITDICKQRQGRWPKTETQFDHEHGRGGGKQDDRIEVNGVPQNGAVCPFCNCEKGSRKVAYNYFEAP